MACKSLIERYSQRRFVVSVLLVMGLVAGFFVTSPARSQSKKQSESYFLKVNNRTVTTEYFKDRLQKSIKKTIRKMKREGRKVPSRGSIEKQIIRKLTDGIVKKIIFEEHAKQSDVEVPDTDVQKRIDRRIQEHGSREDYLEVLKERDKTLDDVRETIRKRLRVKRYIKRNRPDFEVTDEDVRMAYEKNKDKFDTKKEEKIKKFLRNKIRERKRRQARLSLLNQLREKSDIDVNYEALKE